MNWTIPSMDHTFYLANAIEGSEDGDVIVVSSDTEKQLAERAKERMCPDKKITFVVLKDEIYTA